MPQNWLDFNVNPYCKYKKKTFLKSSFNPHISLPRTVPQTFRQITIRCMFIHPNISVIEKQFWKPHHTFLSPIFVWFCMHVTIISFDRWQIKINSKYGLWFIFLYGGFWVDGKLLNDRKWKPRYTLNGCTNIQWAAEEISDIERNLILNFAEPHKKNFRNKSCKMYQTVIMWEWQYECNEYVRTSVYRISTRIHPWLNKTSKAQRKKML